MGRLYITEAGERAYMILRSMPEYATSLRKVLLGIIMAEPGCRRMTDPGEEVDFGEELDNLVLKELIEEGLVVERYG